MRKLCPNFDKEDGLDTVLEVPIPEEMFASGGGSRGGTKFWRKNVKASVLPGGRSTSSSLGRAAELQLMLSVVGAPLALLPVPAQKTIANCNLKDGPIEVSMAKYIIQQYIAAVGGEKVLDAASSMYAMGKVQMRSIGLNGNGGSKKGGGRGEMGGFVLWQKRRPEKLMWCLELMMVSGCKITAGSDGRVAWRQTSWQQPHASRGPPRPLRRSLQGLDPGLTANLFADAVWDGEKTVDGEACFALQVDADRAALRARGSGSVEIVRHTAWGYFSQKTGLLRKLEDSYLIRVNGGGGGGGGGGDGVYWESNTESFLRDYRTVDGVGVAHAGRSHVALLRFGDDVGQSRSSVEETWTVEEVEFNIVGLSDECFLAPADLQGDVAAAKGAVGACRNNEPGQVVALGLDSDPEEEEEEEEADACNKLIN